MTLRILHVLDHSIPLHSGYTFRTLAILREQRALGWETVQLTSPKHYATDAAEETIEGWHFYRTPMKQAGIGKLPVVGHLRLMAATASRIEEVARKAAPDVIHAHSPVLNALPALRAGRRLGIPVIYELRALWEDAAVDHGTTREGSPRYRASRWLETRALRRAAHVTTICEGLRREIVSRGIAGEKVTVIPNAVDIEAFRSGREPDESLRRSLDLAGATVLGFLGSFYGYEGLDLVLDALPLVLRRVPNVKILLVGGGPQESSLKQRAVALGISDRVVFAGRVPHGEVQRYYDLIDVLVYPRRSMRLTEIVTPLKPLEAMAQGRLLVASDVGGHRELIEDGKTGYLFAAGDAGELAETVARVLSDRAAWPRIRSTARSFVERERTWQRSVERYIEIYHSVLSAHAVPQIAS